MGTEAEQLCCDKVLSNLPGVGQLQKSLPQLVRLFYVLSREQGKNLGVTALQGYVLMGLQINGPLTMTEISDYTKLAASTMTRVVDKLVKTGLVKRQHDKQDRRVVRLELTASGEEKSTQFRTLQGLLFRELLAGLSEIEREHVLAGLAILVARLERLSERFHDVLDVLDGNAIVPEIVLN